MQLWIAIICIVAAVLIGGAVGVFAGITIRKNTAEKEIGSAEEEARKIVADALKKRKGGYTTSHDSES